MTPDELLAAYNLGDDLALEQLFLELRGPLRAVAYCIVRDHAGADDVVQECMLHVIRSRDGEVSPWDPARGRATTWLYNVVRGRALDQLRRERRHPTGPFPGGPTGNGIDAADPRPEPGSSAALGLDLVEVIHSMPEDQRRVAWLRYIELMPVSEIIPETGIPQTQVYRLLNLAYSRIEPLLRPEN